MDFVAATLLDGRRFRALTVVDTYTRRSQLMESDLTLTRTTVVAALERVAKRSGYPQMITVDNVLYPEVKSHKRKNLRSAAPGQLRNHPAATFPVGFHFLQRCC